MEFNQQNILLDVEVKNKNELFQYIENYAKINHIIDDDKGLVDAFLEREKEVSTGLQDSFAIPHVKSDIIKKSQVIFLKLKKPIEWETFDNKPVLNVFALLVPNQFKGTVHLEMISKIATSLLEKEFIENVKNSSNVDELKKYITKAMEGAY